MPKHRSLFTALLAFMCTLSLGAAEYTAASAKAFKSALAKAGSGDVIILEDATWKDVQLKIDRGGSAKAPLTIKARNPGKVVISGHSKLEFTAPYVVIDGLLFTEGSLGDKDGSLIYFSSNNCRLTNSAVVNYNPTDHETSYYWVYFRGNNNRLDHCYFTGKSHKQPVVGNSDTPESLRNRVDHCYIKDIPYIPEFNGREIFRIWGYNKNAEDPKRGAYFTIEDNLLDHADGEGVEVISFKSNHNIARRNTIIRSRGGVTNRNGHYNTIVDNVILCDQVDRAYGIRLTGEGNTVTGNFVRGGECGITLMAGEYNERSLSSSYKKLEPKPGNGRIGIYFQVKDNTIKDNTIVDSTGADIIIGSFYKTHWPESQRIMLPESSHFEGNLIVRSTPGIAFDAPAPEKNPPLPGHVFAPNTFANNIVWNGTVALIPAPDGITIKKGTAPTPAVPTVLTPADVGPDWVRTLRDAGDKRFP